MNAVILCGSPGTALFPLANDHPKALLPLANEPLLAHTLRTLRECRIAEVAIVGPGQRDHDRDTIERLIAAVPDLKVSYREEAQVSGTAGALRALRTMSDADFVVLGVNVFVTAPELKAVLEAHQARGNAATMVVERVQPRETRCESVEIDAERGVQRIRVLHRSMERRRSLRPSGVYVFGTTVLDSIPLRGYMDIREQLVPALCKDGIRVDPYISPSPVRKVDTDADYFELNREILSSAAARDGDWGREIQEDVWVGERSDISPRTHLIGPIRIGNDCVLADDVEIVGPTSIGDGTRVGQGTFIRESVLFPRARLMPRSRLEYCIVDDGARVAEATALKQVIFSNGEHRQPLDVRDSLRDRVPKGYVTPFTSSVRRRLEHQLYLAAKRTLDVVASAVGLLVLLPLLPFITLAIRIDSPGPAIYRQRRCGKHGREFTMYKFRTMMRGAERSQEDLSACKDVDGPMFKLREDPRITRVGRVLRRSGLDELPQLLNVFKGEMTLVGPRPLVMSEMKFAPSWRDIRLHVRPGVTGLWQIGDRGSVSFHNWISSDIYYVRHQSLVLDLRILWKTFLFSIRRSGS